MTRQSRQEKRQPSDTLRGPEASELFAAFVGFDLRLVRTIRDLVIHPVRVAKEALGGEKNTYLGQVRLFIFLLGIQTLLLSLMKTYDFVSVDAILQKDDMLQRYAQLVQANGYTLQQVNAALVGWFNLLITPINAINVIIFALFFKLMERRITILGHALLVITAYNAATLISVPLVILASHVFGSAMLANVMAIPVQIFYLGLFVWAFMRQGKVDGVVKIILLLLIFLLFVVLINGLVWSIMDRLLEHRFGMGPWHFIFQQARAAAP